MRHPSPPVGAEFQKSSVRGLRQKPHGGWPGKPQRVEGNAFEACLKSVVSSNHGFIAVCHRSIPSECYAAVLTPFAKHMTRVRSCTRSTRMRSENIRRHEPADENMCGPAAGRCNI